MPVLSCLSIVSYSPVDLMVGTCIPGSWPPTLCWIFIRVDGVRKDEGWLHYGDFWHRIHQSFIGRIVSNPIIAIIVRIVWRRIGSERVTYFLQNWRLVIDWRDDMFQFLCSFVVYCIKWHRYGSNVNEKRNEPLVDWTIWMGCPLLQMSPCAVLVHNFHTLYTNVPCERASISILSHESD